MVLSLITDCQTSINGMTAEVLDITTLPFRHRARLQSTNLDGSKILCAKKGLPFFAGFFLFGVVALTVAEVTGTMLCLPDLNIKQWKYINRTRQASS